MNSAPIDVCAAVIRDRERYLLATRPPHSHLAGAWEFPGGKVRPDETVAECVCRELHEELGVEITAGSLIASIVHRYPDKTVRLLFLDCALHPASAPFCPREGQQTGWFTLAEMTGLDLAPADRRFVDFLVGRGSANLSPLPNGR